MKKFFQDAVDQSVETPLGMGQFLRLRPFFVIALVIPFLVGMHWFTYFPAEQQERAFPRIVQEMQQLKQLSEHAVSHGKRRFAVKVPQAGNPADGRRLYEGLRSDVSALIDKLSLSAPRGIAHDEGAEIELLRQRVSKSFVHMQKWVYGPAASIYHNPLEDLASRLHVAQRRFSKPHEQFQTELEACRLVPWQPVR